MTDPVSAADGPQAALVELAALLRAEQTPIRPHIIEPEVAPEHGPIAAAGRQGAEAAEYALVTEAVREGYLLHYGEPRILSGHDDDLALLAGDYLYALGIERLARLGDAAAVTLLADLIADCAKLHAEGRGADSETIWRAAAKALADSAADG